MKNCWRRLPLLFLSKMYSKLLKYLPWTRTRVAIESSTSSTLLHFQIQKDGSYLEPKLSGGPALLLMHFSHFSHLLKLATFLFSSLVLQFHALTQNFAFHDCPFSSHLLLFYSHVYICSCPSLNVICCSFSLTLTSELTKRHFPISTFNPHNPSRSTKRFFWLWTHKLSSACSCSKWWGYLS